MPKKRKKNKNRRNQAKVKRLVNEFLSSWEEKFKNAKELVAMLESQGLSDNDELLKGMAEITGVSMHMIKEALFIGKFDDSKSALTALANG